MNVAVLWSGGIDSTYLVYKNLEEGNSVVAVRNEILNNANQNLAEKNAVEKMISIFENKYGTRFSFQEGISFDIKFKDNNTTFHQMPLWLLSCMYLYSVDEIQIAYVMGDDAISYLEDIKKLLKKMEFVRQKQVPITFPLIKWKKSDFNYLLPKNIVELIVNCEDIDNEGNRCNNCHKCTELDKLLSYQKDVVIGETNMEYII